jgi:hypothetical protein
MPTEDPIVKTTQELVDEVILTAVALDNILGSLLADVPDDAFPGEDKTEVLLQMIVGSIVPAARAAGEDNCRTATALVAAMRERMLADLHAAAEAATAREDRQHRGR